MTSESRYKFLLILCPPFWQNLPPLGPAYLTDYLSNQGICADFYDLNIELYHSFPKDRQKSWTMNPEHFQESFYSECVRKFPGVFSRLIEKIGKEKYPVIGLTVLKSSREFCRALIQEIRAEFPGVKLVAGGPEVFAADIEDRLSDLKADAVVVGEGERGLADLILGSDEKLIRYRQLDNIDYFPVYRQMNIDVYPLKESSGILTGRGCINRCRFCTERKLYQGFRSRSPENVLEEIRYLYHYRGVRRFIFLDSMFNADLKNMERLLSFLLEERRKGIRIKWEAQIGVRKNMDDHLFRLMKATGAYNLFIGLESGSEEMLKKMNKFFIPDEASVFFRKLMQVELHFEVSLITHYPGEEERHFCETVEFLRKNRHNIPKIAQLSRFQAYPGHETEIPEDYVPDTGNMKIKRMIDFFDSEGFRYTSSYIDNLF